MARQSQTGMGKFGLRRIEYTIVHNWMNNFTFVFNNGLDPKAAIFCPPFGTYESRPTKICKLPEGEELGAITFGIHHFNNNQDVFGLSRLTLTSRTNQSQSTCTLREEYRTLKIELELDEHLVAARVATYGQHEACNI
jgi:hypothetical protein